MNKFLFLLLILLGQPVLSQNDTIRIVKNEISIYKCVTEPAFSWYLRFKNNECLLVDLKIAPSQVTDWFDKYSNSQNIYKSTFSGKNTAFLNFAKTNDPLDTLVFRILELTTDTIKVEIVPTKEIFEFKNFRM